MKKRDCHGACVFALVPIIRETLFRVLLFNTPDCNVRRDCALF